jgi:hypothetical protein
MPTSHICLAAELLPETARKYWRRRVSGPKPKTLFATDFSIRPAFRILLRPFLAWLASFHSVLACDGSVSPGPFVHCNLSSASRSLAIVRDDASDDTTNSSSQPVRPEARCRCRLANPDAHCCGHEGRKESSERPAANVPRKRSQSMA